MATSSATVSRWARGFVAASALWFVCWQLASVAGLGRRVTVVLGLYGFVLHVIFGKAYSLVPSYFDRELAVPRAPAVHLPLAVIGAAGLALAPLRAVPGIVGTVGATLWALGVAVFVGTLLSTIRGNLAGRETGTGEHNRHRRRVDRVANAFVPVALAYLAVGTYGVLAAQLSLPWLLDGLAARHSHLLAAGTGGLLVFVIGFRLLPRFLVAEPPAGLAHVVLPAGALGPALLAVGLPTGPALAAGAVLQSIAVVGFAAGYAWLFWDTDRDRVGFYDVLAGAAAGVAVVALGLSFAFGALPGGATAALVAAHYRLALLGFLGLTIVGVAFQFYPPGVLQIPVDGDRLAGGVILALAGGLAVEVAGRVGDAGAAVTAGQTLALVGTVGYASLVLGLFVQRARG